MHVLDRINKEFPSGQFSRAHLYRNLHRWLHKLPVKCFLLSLPICITMPKCIVTVSRLKFSSVVCLSIHHRNESEFTLSKNIKVTNHPFSLYGLVI